MAGTVFVFNIGGIQSRPPASDFTATTGFSASDNLSSGASAAVPPTTRPARRRRGSSPTGR
jgi:hypothetical protein